MINITLGSIYLFAAILLDGLFSASGSALINSHPSRLLRRKNKGIFASDLAERMASETTRLLMSIKLGKGILRAVILILALATYSSWVSDWIANMTAVFAILIGGSWLLTGGIELLAENFVLRKPEAWAVRLAPLMAVFTGVLSPLGKLINRIAGVLAGAKEGRQHPLVTEEEIMTLVDAGEEGGIIEQDERQMIYSIFQLGDTLAREVMSPRIDIIAFEECATIRMATDTLLETGFSRAPVFSETIDNVIGLVYIKDLLAQWRKGECEQSIAGLMREVYFVPEAKKVDDLLTEMQEKQIHMAVVVDEYGGTAGVVTIEDIVEEIVGEIRDEYDLLEELPYQIVRDGEFIFRGGIDLDDVNQMVDAQLPKDTSETLGGFIYSQLGRVPKVGEVVEVGGLRLVVDQVAGRRIRKVRASQIESSQDEKESNENHT